MLTDGTLVITYTDGTSDNLGTVGSDSTSILVFSPLSDGTVSVKINELFKGSADAVSIKIPSTYKGKKVTKIDDSGFRECTGLTDVIIPSTVKEIGDNAFLQCYQLQNVTLPDGLEKIGNFAFRHCAIEEIVIPASVVRIGGQAFFQGTKFGDPNAKLRRVIFLDPNNWCTQTYTDTSAGKSPVSAELLGNPEKAAKDIFLCNHGGYVSAALVK